MPSASHNSSKDLPGVAIIGGGVIGLGIGWRLAQAGCSVDIYDKGRAGRGASWAAAGMLAAGVELEPGEERLLALTLDSRRRWPEFAAEIEALSGLPVGLRREGTLVAAPTRDDAEQLRFTYELYRRSGLAIEWLSPKEALAHEPFLNPRLAAACFSPEDGQVDNRLLIPALIRCLERAGGRLHEETEVEALETEAGSVAGLVVGGELRPADIVVLAAGAWSRGIGGLPDGIRPPVRPVKGQMLALNMDPAAPLLRHVLWAPKAYLVPRADGRLIVGATTEERGFDETLTAGGMLALLDGAWRVLPGIEELPIAEMWAGFRPGSRDDAPILGECGLPGLILATGHHRNGILLAPVTADGIAEQILTGSTPEILRGWGPERFRRPERKRA